MQFLHNREMSESCIIIHEFYENSKRAVSEQIRIFQESCLLMSHSSTTGKVEFDL